MMTNERKQSEDEVLSRKMPSNAYKFIGLDTGKPINL